MLALMRDGKKYSIRPVIKLSFYISFSGVWNLLYESLYIISDSKKGTTKRRE